MDEKTRGAIRSILSAHGLEQLVGTDIAAAAIPAAAAINVPLLDSAAGYLYAVPTGTYLSQGASISRSTGQWNADPGVTQASLIYLTGGSKFFYSWSGAAGQQNISWGNPNAWIDSAGNLEATGVVTQAVVTQALAMPGGAMGQTNATTPGYLKLGTITLLFGVNSMTTGNPPWETNLWIPFPIAVTQPLIVQATLLSTDDSVVWIAANSWTQTGFMAVVFRTNMLGGVLGALSVEFSWLAVAIT